MNGITVMDRRDLQRLLNGVLHAENRDDVRVEVKYYVQFSYVGSGKEDMAVQTLVDPYNPPSRSASRNMIKEAIKTLDKESKNDTIRTLPNPAPAGSVAAAHETVHLPGLEGVAI